MALVPGSVVSVRVPATSANLGPGFDCLGLALGLYDDVDVQVTDGGLELSVHGEGAPAAQAAGESNLLVRSLREALSALGLPQPGLRVQAVNRIPHGRGLGSSAAAICAGVVAARALAGQEPDPAADLILSARIEGHPDNVAACLYGGLTAAWTAPAGARALSLPLGGLHPVVFVPTAAAQATSAARGLLPAQVPHAVAAHGVSLVVLLVQALAGRAEVLMSAVADQLHEPFRLAAQPEGAGLITRLRAAGVAAVLSGSGPSVLALCTEAGQVALAEGAAPDSGWALHRLNVAVEGARATPAEPGTSSF